MAGTRSGGCCGVAAAVIAGAAGEQECQQHDNDDEKEATDDRQDEDEQLGLFGLVVLIGSRLGGFEAFSGSVVAHDSSQCDGNRACTQFVGHHIGTGGQRTRAKSSHFVEAKTRCDDAVFRTLRRFRSFPFLVGRLDSDGSWNEE